MRTLTCVAILVGLALVSDASRAALVGDYVSCDTVPVPVPRPLFCWDTVLSAVRPNRTNTFAGDTECCPLNLTAPLVILDTQTLYVGAIETGANISSVYGSVRVAAGGHLSVTSMNLTIHGDLVIESGARLSVTESNATQTRVIIDGCLLIGNDTTLSVELAVSEGNQSRAYVIFEVPSGCINGSFGSINATYTLAAGHVTLYPPGMTSCPQPIGLAVLVNIVCEPPQPPQPPPLPPPLPIWLPGDIFGNATVPSSGINDSNNSNHTGPTNTLVSPAPFDWTLWGIVLGVLVAGILAAVITAGVLLRVRSTRQHLFPYRDREHYQPQAPAQHPPMTHYPSAGGGYVFSPDARPYTTRHGQQ